MSNAEQPQTTPATIDGIDRAQWISMAVIMMKIFTDSSNTDQQMPLMMKIIDEGATDDFMAAWHAAGNA